MHMKLYVFKSLDSPLQDNITFPTIYLPSEEVLTIIRDPLQLIIYHFYHWRKPAYVLVLCNLIVKWTALDVFVLAIFYKFCYMAISPKNIGGPPSFWM